MADEQPTQKAEDPAAEAGEVRAEGAEAHEAAEGEAPSREAELEAELAAVKDRLLRALAEAENDRRRAARDREDAAKYGGTRLARDILSVYDNLERAVTGADEATRSAARDFFEGVELTRAELLSAFAKHQIEPIDTSMGVRFDPNLHQAMFEAAIPGAPPGGIVQTMQTGFTIAGRLLRPAFVGVARAAPAEAAAPAPAAGEAGDPAEAADPEPASEEPKAEAAEPAGKPAEAGGGSAAPRPASAPPPPRPGAARTRRD
ncbi:nucleotide exchange factor GrpE [Neomegalonema sp.]|uniref:nucleotide exchange factor GrpE n=1 Tax=Neomegalonema sp. TaxID=2039713 RepID=UPI00263A1D9D|nr:nucleotide exchange factor GrpE [Neomegalonema sp.]MDD2869373.1 nucleotide exchange factor GrpE [Neomegalonema sp.]